MVKVAVVQQPDVTARIRPVMHRAVDRVAERWSQAVQETYSTRGRPAGSWPPLSPKTIAIKKRYGYPLDPLIRTGKMKASYVFKVAKFLRSARIRAYNTKPYWIYQERGTARIPARPQLAPQLYEDELRKVILNTMRVMNNAQ